MPTVNPLEIKRLKKLKKKNQGDIAAYLGLKPSTYGAKEIKGNFNEDEISLLAELFDVDESVLTGEVSLNEQTQEDFALLVRIQTAQLEILSTLVDDKQFYAILKKHGLENMFPVRDKRSR